MLCEAAEVEGDLGEAGAAEALDGGVAEGCQIVGAAAASVPALVVVVDEDANPMQPVFEAPGAAPSGESRCFDRRVLAWRCGRVRRPWPWSLI